MSINDLDYPLNSIYVCSSEQHQTFWLACKVNEFPIASSWLEDAETTAERRIYEARVSRIFIFYYIDEADRPDHLLYEVGAAITAGRRIIFTGKAIDHELALHHGVESISDFTDALTEAYHDVQEYRDEHESRINTYAQVSYRCGTQPTSPSEADLISIHSTPDNEQSAILLPYPAGFELANKICRHIDDAMIAAFTKGQQK